MSDWRLTGSWQAEVLPLKAKVPDLRALAFARLDHFDWANVWVELSALLIIVGGHNGDARNRTESELETCLRLFSSTQDHDHEDR